MRGVQQRGGVGRGLLSAPLRAQIQGPDAPMAASSGHGGMAYFSAL